MPKLINDLKILETFINMVLFNGSIDCNSDTLKQLVESSQIALLQTFQAELVIFDHQQLSKIPTNEESLPGNELDQLLNKTVRKF